jgi:hypothetical protein
VDNLLSPYEYCRNRKLSSAGCPYSTPQDQVAEGSQRCPLHDPRNVIVVEVGAVAVEEKSHSMADPMEVHDAVTMDRCGSYCHLPRLGKHAESNCSRVSSMRTLCPDYVTMFCRAPVTAKGRVNCWDGCIAFDEGERRRDDGLRVPAAFESEKSLKH